MGDEVLGWLRVIADEEPEDAKREWLLKACAEIELLREMASAAEGFLM
jgi:hypothetical protein